jgi:lipoprotein-releasing system ATP-binding protein
MSDVLYEIRDLVCSYDGNSPVLKISSLDLIKGKQTVFIGKSGSGKSTILETLGLMNNTVLSGEIHFHPDPHTTIHLSSLWSSEEELARVRNRYYSFIFQNTNLMDNFSAYENACIPQMIQGVTLDQAKVNIRDAMIKVGLGEVNDSDKVIHLSGGQRQRLAFVRAITPDFEVLFGDEPTGNLDEVNSLELMRFIDTDVHARSRSAILVSHDIDLSLAFADQVVLLMKNSAESFGYTSDQNIFLASNGEKGKVWRDKSGKKITEIKKLLLEKLMN